MLTLLTLALTALLLAPAAAAQEIAVGGYVVHSPGDMTNVALPDGRTLSSGTLRGIIIENDTGSPMHLMPQDCSGTTVLGSDGTLVQQAGSCTGIDADGDLLHLSYFNSPSQSTYHFTGGTGKFAGAEGSGTSEVATMGPDGRFAIRHEAVLRLR